ncbi:MAG: hypothetical protein AAGU17_10550 [Anaerolineaceae bacterium]|jgi:hypothetical protein
MKNWFLLLVVVLILSVPISPVGAQNGPTEPGGISVDLPSSPYVIYPKYEDITTKTPTFRFTDYSEYGATKYRIELYNDETEALIYQQTGTGNCDGTECTMQLLIPLKFVTLDSDEGEYRWRIRAKVGGEWPPLWDQATFRVLKPKFTSLFDVDYKKWTPLFGDWGITSAGYLKGNGVGDNQYSIIQNHLVVNGYVYEVRMKRKLNTNTENRLYFNAYPYPTSWNRWDSGYGFDYYNNGRWRLVQREAGVQTILIPEADSSAIVPYGWNKLTIWSNPPNFHFWINEVYLGSYSLTTFDEGYVGIGMLMHASYEPLLVDWATLKYSDTAPYPIP